MPAKVEPRFLSDQEINELAEGCVTLLAIQGKSIALTLSEMSVEAGGFLLPEDIPRVREKAEGLVQGRPIIESDGIGVRSAPQ
jgi:hypothetical protein